VSAAQAALNAVLNKASGTSFAVQAWNMVVVPVLKTANWIQGGSIGQSLVGLLSLNDTNGQLARSYNRAPDFVSSSNDPLVWEVDSMLNNGGQPLTAGSAPLYGTYYDPRTAAAFKIMTVAAGIVVGGIVGGPIGAALAAAVLINEDSLRGGVHGGERTVNVAADECAAGIVANRTGSCRTGSPWAMLPF